jgi:uncharacterized BrkB/YihY/UPF0761 family membrane protein
VKAYGALGVSLVVLSFLGYISFNLMLLGFALIALDTYTSHNYYKDVEYTKNALLTVVSLLLYTLSNEEEIIEDE